MRTLSHTAWYKCTWCGWWGYFDSKEAPLKYKLLGHMDGIGELCDRRDQLKEPPWWPNNRDRCHEWLLKVFRKSRMAQLCTYTQRNIAEYLAENDP